MADATALVADPGDEYARLLTDDLGQLTWCAAHVRIVPEEGKRIIPLVPNPAQLAYLKAVGHRRRALTLKGRRTGITTIELACDFERINNCDHYTAVMTAHTAEDSGEIHLAAQLMHDEMPAGVQQRKRTTNARVLDYPKRRSRLSIRTAGGKGIKRGGTLQKVHMTEVARYKDKATGDTIVGLLEAARAGIVHGESTAAGASGWFYDTWQENYGREDAEWFCLFVPWWWDLRNRVRLSGAERRDFTYTDAERAWAEPYSVSPEAVAWYRKKAKELGPFIKQEYPCSPLEAFIVTGRHFFDQEIVLEASRRAKKPIQSRDNGELLVWAKPEEDVKYVAGGDPAEGTPTGDWSYLTINRHDTAEQVARLRGKWVPAEFAKRSARLCAQYNKAFVVPEDNRPEYPRRLRELGYRNLFHRKLPNGKRHREPGFNTNGKTRPVMLDFGKEALEGYGQFVDDPVVMHDPIFFQECTTFEDQGGGDYRANPGKHDDSVLAYFVMLQGRRVPQPKVRFLRM